MVKLFLPDHPLLSKRSRLANLVFSDYVRAYLLQACDGVAIELGVASVESYLPDPGPSFFSFAHAFTATAATGMLGFIPESQVQALISSYSASGDGGVGWAYQYDGSSAVLRFHPSSPDDITISFRVEDFAASLSLLPRWQEG